jgi:hypothetical protein
MGIQFTPDMMSGIFAYVGDIFNDVKLPVLLICGVAIAFFILEGVLEGIMIRKEREREEEAEAEESVLAPVFRGYHAHQKEARREEARERLFHED